MTSNQPLPPFSCTYSAQIPELLLQLNCTIAITTYQAGKVVFLSPKNQEHLVQLPRNFRKAMGLTLEDDKLAVATLDEVAVFRNSVELAQSYPQKKDTYDALFMPRATYYTGRVDIHDLHWGSAGLWAVNTSFSCLTLVNEDFSFTPKWKPFFISDLQSEDRCHLNGLAMENGEPRFATALGQTNMHQGWRENIVSGGVLLDVPSNEIVAANLPMPHSPRLWKEGLHLLLSATGELARVDTKTGKYDVVKKISGFVRGMARLGDYVFIGLSRLRKNSSTFKHLKIAEESDRSGIVVLHLPTAAIVGEIIYQRSVDEIYDVQILPGIIRPNILGTDKEVHRLGLHTPGATYWAAPGQQEQL